MVPKEYLKCNVEILYVVKIVKESGGWRYSIMIQSRAGRGHGQVDIVAR